MSYMAKRYVLVFSGYNPRAIYAFLRTLDYNHINYAIIASSNKDDILLTKYKDNVLYIRKEKNLEYLDIKKGILTIKNITKAEELLIAPSTEGLNRFLLDNRKAVEVLGCIIPLVNKETYETISDKAKFGKLCMEKGISVPKELDISRDFVPFVAKPIQYYAKNMKKALSPVIIKNTEDLYNFKCNYNLLDFYFQEYIDGKSIYLLYYFDKDGTCYKFSQENLIQQPEGKSIIAALSANYHNEDMSIEYESLFRKVGYRGFVMIEVRQYNGVNYMIEANPRFWGPSQLFVDAEANFFEAFLYDYNLLLQSPIFQESREITKYFWYGGVLEILRKDLNLVFYNKNEKEFLNELSEWVRYDIYNRCDTISIFNEECRL